jgi:hypothetical protein
MRPESLEQEGVRSFFRTPTGYAVAGVIILAAVVGLYYSVKANLGNPARALGANERVVVCSETGRWWTINLKPGMTFPIDSPYSNKKTGHLAEASCNWTADGKVGDKTTYLLLSETTGRHGPTFCPDCHRLVVRDNPKAAPGRTPPPTEQEYAAKAAEK